MKKILVSLLAALLLLCTGCSQPKEQTLQIFAMDTVMMLTSYGENGPAALAAAEDTIFASGYALAKFRMLAA